MINSINKQIKKTLNNPYFMIFLVYFICHWFIIIVTGMFWDDLSWDTHDYQKYNQFALMNGHPEWSVLIPFAWSFPNNSYRVLVFCLYFIQAILFYKILIKLNILDKSNSLWLTLLYITVPANDARFLLTTFPYCVGLSFFLSALYLYVMLKCNSFNKKYKYILLRFLTIILFTISFFLNSLLFFYFLIFILDLIYRCYFDIKYNNFTIKNIFRIFKIVIFNNIDFIILPFLHFFIKASFFPTYGYYAYYNKVTISGLIRAIPHSFVILLDTIRSYLNSPSLIIIIIIISLITIQLKNSEYHKGNYDRYPLFFFISFLIIYFGIFPYIVIGRSRLMFTGVEGRDSILLPFGFSFCIFTIVSLLQEKSRKYFFALFIILGIIHFNYWYLQYQKDYYNQLAFENKINEEYIDQNQNFIIINKTPTIIKCDRFYTFSANARHAFNNKKHLFLNGIYDLVYLNVDYLQNSFFLELMPEINPNNTDLNGVILFSGNYSTIKVIKLKILELFNKKNFKNEINSIGKIEIIQLNKEQSDCLRYLFDTEIIEHKY